MFLEGSLSWPKVVIELLSKYESSVMGVSYWNGAVPTRLVVEMEGLSISVMSIEVLGEKFPPIPLES